MRSLLLAALPAALALSVVFSAYARDDKKKLGYDDTPILPGTKWHVHDGDRPQPRVVTPGTSSTQDQPGRPPSDAVVLFDGKSLDRWQEGGKPVRWKVEDGAMVIAPKGGSIASKDEFGDCQIHLEFASPKPPKGEGQGRGNSGVMVMGQYEIQVLDSYEAQTYPDGQAAAIYGQYPPLVNASRPPGEWQTYDILFTRPRFKDDGSVETPAYVTMFHNGVLVHNHDALLGAVAFRAVAKYSKHGPKGPIVLQDHGNPVRFRNIWVRPLED